MKTILVTGGAGFIGSETVLALLARGYEVSVLDTLDPQVHGRNPFLSPTYMKIKDFVRFIHGSVCSLDDCQSALSNVDAVLHLAALTGTGQSMFEPTNYVNTNATGTATLLKAISLSKKKSKIVLASSRSIYGEGKYSHDHFPYYPKGREISHLKSGKYEIYLNGIELKPDLTDESSLCMPGSVYASTKLMQENLVQNMAHICKHSPVILRYQNVYGPGQSLLNPYTGIISIFTKELFRGAEIDIFEDGKSVRDFIYIDNVVQANVNALELQNDKVEIINIGSGVATTVLEVLLTLAKNMGISPSFQVTGNFRPGDIRHCVADIKKYHSIMAPRIINFNEGCRRFVEWALSDQSGLNLNSEVSYAQSLEISRQFGALHTVENNE